AVPAQDGRNAPAGLACVCVLRSRFHRERSAWNSPEIQVLECILLVFRRVDRGKRNPPPGGSPRFFQVLAAHPQRKSRRCSAFPATQDLSEPASLPLDRNLQKSLPSLHD